MSKILSNINQFTPYLVLILSFAVILIRFLSYDYDKNFGYMDPQSFWQNTTDFVNGKVIYKDYFSEYGIFGLILRAPIHILMKGTFFSSIVNNYLFIPLLALILSFMIGKIYFSKLSLTLFLLLILIFQSNTTYDSIRHLIPELGLILCLTNNKKNLIIGNILLAISIISSPEYGLVANITVLLFYIYNLKKKNILYFIPQLIVGLVWLIYLVTNNTLSNYFIFFTDYVKSFYSISPSRDIFPRINDFVHSYSYSNLSRLNYYLIPLSLLLLLIFVNKKIQNKHIIYFTSIFALLAYFRTINTPDYINYGLIFVFFPMIYYIFLTTINQKTKLVFIILLFWLFISQIGNFYGQLKTSVDQLPSNIRFGLSPKLSSEYLEVTNFIKFETQPNDKIFVYPNGPYYQLANRNSAFPFYSKWLYSLTPNLNQYALNYLELNSPKMVIINNYNALDIFTRMNNFSYGINSVKDQIIFKTIRTPIEDFIQNNYQIKQKFDLAWVLEKRPKPIVAKNYYDSQGVLKNYNYDPSRGVVKLDNNNFKVVKNRPIIGLNITRKDLPNKNLLIKIPVKINLGLIQSFSKFQIKTYGLNQGTIENIQTLFVPLDQQNIWIDFPSSYEDYLTIQVTDNYGFLPFGRPESIYLGDPEIFIRNSDIKSD